MSTTFSHQTPEYLDALDREIYDTNPVPLNSAPPLNPPQSDSEVTLSDLSPMKSADFKLSDPQSPPHILYLKHTPILHTLLHQIHYPMTFKDSQPLLKNTSQNQPHQKPSTSNPLLHLQ